jgi:superfamily II DNA or RNA helicase
MIPLALMRRFELDVQGRGEAHANAGAITLRETSSELLDATIEASTNHYELRIHAIPGLLRLRCSCPAALEHGPCKHLWALLRFTDREKLLQPLLDTAGPLARFGFEQRADEPEGDEPAPSWLAPLREMQWQLQLADPPGTVRAATGMPADRRLLYLIDLDASAKAETLRVEVGTERKDRDGTWGDVRRYHYAAAAWFNAPEPIDRQIAEMLLGANPEEGITGMPAEGFAIRTRAFSTTLRMICDTGRARIRSADRKIDNKTVKWDDGAPWKLQLRVETERDGSYSLGGSLTRPNTFSVSLEDVKWLHRSGIALIADNKGALSLARCEHAGAWPLALAMRETGTLPLGIDPSPFLEQFHRLPTVPPITLPKGEELDSVDTTPIPMLTISRELGGWRTAPAVIVLRFRYGTSVVEPSSRAPTTFDKSSGVLYRRNTMFERSSRARLLALGAREDWMARKSRDAFLVPPTHVAELSGTLSADGWHIELDGRAFFAADPLRVQIRSDENAFDLTGSVSFGPHVVTLPTLFDAVQRQEELIELGEGAIGLIPADELSRLRMLLALGTRTKDTVRFGRAQLLLLDALLEQLPLVDVDEQLAHARAELRQFTGIQAPAAPAGFVGELRGYQREGLGWFDFLRRFGLGGCLADDMGLGKTIQVLALLEERRVARAAEGAAGTAAHGLSLLVVPRSLVFNWKREAERFIPKLRMLDLSGADREVGALDADDADVVVTTYGTLRRDIQQLGKRDFDYVVLDEAQAIKNASTATAKAARLLRSRHRLALSGTPIENRIEELWSLFEFLNPGMLGAATRFSTIVRGAEAVDGEPVRNADAVLARALRPVILRRTKGMVAPELPARIEQTLEVELEPKQRAFYEVIRKQFASRVLAEVDKHGIAKSRMHILEALLRLRQAACHPALVDPERDGLPSAKLDAIVPALQEVASEGHKILVFSQFTSFLALLRTRLDAEQISYEYLDGRTRDRQAHVDNFQRADGPPIFLISLKAGGHGLNLTAAEYVYLLDPWWNPAVEAQAIDRAHRIGQTQQVMATRVVARDTIESKILELQASKRALADAILTEDKGGLTGIGRAELELLFG